MKSVGKYIWCNEGTCPCPVKQFLKQRMSCFSLEAAANEIGERMEKVENCLNHWFIQDFVCRDGNLWCPDNPN